MAVKMMLCENCGAEIPEDTVVCPYCDYEIPHNAEKELQQEVDSIRNRRIDMEELSENRVRKGTRTIVGIFLGLIILAVLVAIVVAVYTYVRSRTELSRQQAQIRKLEEYYQAGEYVEMYEYLNEKVEKYYSQTFEKYYFIGDIANSMEQWEEDGYGYDWKHPIQYARDNPGRLKSDFIDYDIKALIADLGNLRTHREQGYRYGEDVAAKYYEDMIHRLLLEEYLMTEEEIDAEVARYQEAEANYDYLGVDEYAELAETLAARITEYAEKS